MAVRGLRRRLDADAGPARLGSTLARGLLHWLALSEARGISATGQMRALG
jgi:hypothetical protein